MANVVADIAKSRYITVNLDDSAEAIRRIMRDYGFRVVAVTDRGKFVGVISRAEILLVTGTKTEARARDLVVQPKIVLEPSVGIVDALKQMLRVDEWYAPIVEKGYFKTFLGLEDIIEYMLEAHKSKLENTRIKNIMTLKPIAVRPEDPISSVWKLMIELRYTGLPVVDSKGVIVGIITQYDLLRKGYARIHLEAARGPAKTPKVKTVMTKPCTYLYPSSTALEAAVLMVNRNIGRIPVAEDSKTRRLVGIIDREDIAKLLLL
ncbi:MAG: CBS domain-containing protein [Acidilobaceae archaeon]